jgi:anti-sigma B factor antagonist
MGLSVEREELLTPEIRQAGSHATVKLSGELDTSTVPVLYTVFAELSNDGVIHVALDFTGLSFLDSTGLSVLVAEHKRVTSLGGEMVIFECQPNIARLFEVTGLNEVLDVRPAKPAPGDVPGEVAPD